MNLSETDRKSHITCRWRLAPALVALVVLVAAACSSSDADPSTVLEDHAAAYNAHDLDAVVALFAEDAIVTGHPLDPTGITEGREAIRELEEEALTISASENADEYTNIVESGNTVTFGHLFTTSSGQCFSGDGHRVVVEDGKIVRWDWGTHSQPCG